MKEKIKFEQELKEMGEILKQLSWKSTKEQLIQTEEKLWDMRQEKLKIDTITEFLENNKLSFDDNYKILELLENRTIIEMEENNKIKLAEKDDDISYYNKICRKKRQNDFI